MPPQDRTPHPSITYARPARRGDIARAAAQYDSVLLIDGVFHHDLAPTPKECYEASQHARCFGAASMGALRAAECEPYGFIPLGAIALWYARERIDGDDEVALLADPESDAALTVPSVNVRYAMRLAQRRGLLRPDEAQYIVERAREVYYMDRTWDDVFELVPERTRAAVADIAKRDGDLKRLDARFALRRMLRNL